MQITFGKTHPPKKRWPQIVEFLWHSFILSLFLTSRSFHAYMEMVFTDTDLKDRCAYSSPY